MVFRGDNLSSSHFFTHSVTNSVTSSWFISIISALLPSSSDYSFEKSQHNISTFSIKYKYIINKIPVHFQYNSNTFSIQYRYILNTIPVHSQYNSITLQYNTKTFLIHCQNILNTIPVNSLFIPRKYIFFCILCKFSI